VATNQIAALWGRGVGFMLQGVVLSELGEPSALASSRSGGMKGRGEISPLTLRSNSRPAAASFQSGGSLPTSAPSHASSSGMRLSLVQARKYFGHVQCPDQRSAVSLCCDSSTTCPYSPADHALPFQHFKCHLSPRVNGSGRESRQPSPIRLPRIAVHPGDRSSPTRRRVLPSPFPQRRPPPGGSPTPRHRGLLPSPWQHHSPSM